MRKTAWLVPAITLTLSGAGTVSATDYWDLSTFNDNGFIETFNELVHGLSQQHDLEANIGPVADEDWTYFFTPPRSSFEAMIDSASGDIAGPLSMFQRLDGSGSMVVQTSETTNVGAAVGGNLALRWQNTNATFTLNYLRIQSGGCTTDCGPEDQYHLQFYDTTVAVPRFNNAGGQTTVLIVQNPTTWTRDIAGTAYFWSPTGTLLGSTTFSLAAKAALVLNTSTVPGVAGVSGTVTIAHDGGYGNLAVKAVALEPATGFSFDSPGVYKPR
jgi:hypothetical protein